MLTSTLRTISKMLCLIGFYSPLIRNNAATNYPLFPPHLQDKPFPQPSLDQPPPCKHLVGKGCFPSPGIQPRVLLFVFTILAVITAAKVVDNFLHTSQ